MEIYDFIWFLVMLGFLSVPFGAIYFILYTLNWNERESLFSESWAVFLAWLISSISAFFVLVLIDHKLYRYNFSGFGFVEFLSPLVIAANIVSIALVLTLKVREREKRLSVTDNDEENIRKTDNKQIWKTSVIVSVLVLAAVVSLGIFIVDISNRTKKLNPKSDSGFVIYD